MPSLEEFVERYIDLKYKTDNPCTHEQALEVLVFWLIKCGDNK